jgi:hypothetical protein
MMSQNLAASRIAIAIGIDKESLLILSGVILLLFSPAFVASRGRPFYLALRSD